MIVFVRAFGKIYSVLQSDYTGIMRRLLKFPPVEDVHILISMGLSYQEKLQGRNTLKLSSPTKNQPIIPVLKPVQEKPENVEKPKIFEAEAKANLVDPLKFYEKNIDKQAEKIAEKKGIIEFGANKSAPVQKTETPAENKEESKKTSKVDNSLVEKCNSALLLLLEQSDE